MKLRLLPLLLMLSSTAHADLVQNAYLKPPQSDEDDLFGSAIAVHGDTLVVGSPFEDGSGTGVNPLQNEASLDSGAAYVYVRSGSSWVLQAYLKASNTGAEDHFGSSVAVYRNFIVVGAPDEDGNGASQSNNSNAAAGAVYVFARNGTTWTQQAYLKSSTAEAGAGFGHSVAVSESAGDDFIAVGAWLDDTEGTDAGAAYVFRGVSSVWTQQAYLTASNADPDDKFGCDVAMHDGIIAVGAYDEDSRGVGVDDDETDNSEDGSGAVYVFAKNGNAWPQQAYLKPSNTDPGDHFGFSVSVSHDTVVVGAPLEDSLATGVDGSQGSGTSTSSGAVYVFTRNGSSWSHEAYVKATHNVTGAQFGYDVCVQNHALVVTANAEDSGYSGINGDLSAPAINASGAAYTYRRKGSAWSPGVRFKASNPRALHQFGGAVSLWNDTLAVAAASESSKATGINSDQGDDSLPSVGAVYAYDKLLPTVAKTGTVAPGGPNLKQSTIGAAAIGGEGDVIWLQNLAGSGSTGGRNKAVLSTMAPGNDATDLVAQSRVSFYSDYTNPTDKFASFSAPMANYPGNALYRGILYGPGVSSKDNDVLMLDDGVFTQSLITTGSRLLAFGGSFDHPTIHRFIYTLQGHSTNRIMLGCKLRSRPSVPVTPAEDTAIGFLSYQAGHLANPDPREGLPAYGGGANFGEFGPHSAITPLAGLYFFTAMRTPLPTGTPVNAIFSTDAGGSATSLVVKAGDVAPGSGGLFFSNFTGMTGRLADPLFKATLKGQPASKNEGLWGSSGIVMLESEPFVSDVSFGIWATKIIRYWPVNVLLNGQAVMLVNIAGTGVTAAGNQAVVLRQSDGEYMFLLRKGDFAPGLGQTKIAAILSVDVNPMSGDYAIVASLKDTPPSSNLALFVGNTQRGPNTTLGFAHQTSRRPTARLRKGAYYASRETPGSFIKSLAIRPYLDPSGAGGRGFAQAVGADGTTAVYLTNSAGATELIALRP
ncbi:MAG: FG-GAP repeat protein [Verrucomicrobiaceae bacterium]|nr:FG-GAP repeat protein [Verrucomicrobiaceae bacterium]